MVEEEIEEEEADIAHYMEDLEEDETFEEMEEETRAAEELRESGVQDLAAVAEPEAGNFGATIGRACGRSRGRGTF